MLESERTADGIPRCELSYNIQLTYIMHMDKTFA